MGENALLEAALAYARRGWMVFPCRPRAKIPATAHGVKDASADPDVIRRWWRKMPAANIGLACGPSGLVVIDIDGPGGWQSWRELRAGHRPAEETLKSVTGGGGAHLLYLAPPGVHIRNSAGKLAPGIDVRASGGYIVAPPSIHPNGTPYVFDGACADPGPLPADLLATLSAPERTMPAQAPPVPAPPPVTTGDAYGEAALRGELEILRRSREGTRNAALNRAAFSLGRLVTGGYLGRWPVEDALLEVATQIGLSESEAHKTIASGLDTGMLSPRYAASKTNGAGHGSDAAAGTREPPVWLSDDALAEQLHAAPAPAAPALKILTARELLTTRWQEPVWVVPGLLPVGLTLLAGRPKIGKSWLALQLTQAVACAGMFLGKAVERGECLYLALEDPPRRLAERMKLQGWQDLDAPAGFSPVGSLRAGGGEELAQAIKGKGYKLVVIDTLSRALAGDQNDNAAMTAALTPLQETAHAMGAAVVLLDHHNKVGSATTGTSDGGLEPDPLVNILGSTAKGAMADCIMGLYRQAGKRSVMLVVLGREMEEQRLDLEMDAQTHVWQPASSATMDATMALPAIIEDLGRATCSDIAKALGKDRANVHGLLQDLVHKGFVARDGRYYVMPGEGGSGED